MQGFHSIKISSHLENYLQLLKNTWSKLYMERKVLCSNPKTEKKPKKGKKHFLIQINCKSTIYVWVSFFSLIQSSTQSPKQFTLKSMLKIFQCHWKIYYFSGTIKWQVEYQIRMSKLLYWSEWDIHIHARCHLLCITRQFGNQ